MASPPTTTGLPYGALSSRAKQHDTSPQAIQQRAYVAAGKCAQCGKRREKGLTWFCRACTDAVATRYAERKEAGICPRCGGDVDGEYTYCKECRAKRAKDAARRRRA